MGQEAFFRIFEGHARQAPGSETSTREALRRLPFASRPRRVIDLGCGTGASTLVLASVLRVPIVAVDLYRPSIEQRIETLRPEAAQAPELASAIAATEREIAVYREHGTSYGYVFHLLRRAD